MKYSNRGLRESLFPVFVAAILAAAGCSDDKSTEPKDDPPDLPPLSSFNLDFDTFPLSNPSIQPPSVNLSEVGLLSKENWGWAALNVGVWQTIVTVGMAVPAAAFVESFEHNPVQQPDGTWLWSYNFSIPQSVQHTAELHADVDNNGIQWSMYISKQGEYSDFLWYSGWCDLLLEEGTWALNRDPGDPSPWVGIVWHRDAQSGTGDIKYTNIAPESPENGGYIFYGTTTDVPYDAFYDIYNGGQDNHTEIRWSLTDNAGEVNDPLHFGDDDWHCWDSDLEDVECPEPPVVP